MRQIQNKVNGSVLQSTKYQQYVIGLSRYRRGRAIVNRSREKSKGKVGSRYRLVGRGLGLSVDFRSTVQSLCCSTYLCVRASGIRLSLSRWYDLDRTSFSLLSFFFTVFILIYSCRVVFFLPPSRHVKVGRLQCSACAASFTHYIYIHPYVSVNRQAYVCASVSKDSSGCSVESHRRRFVVRIT